MTSPDVPHDNFAEQDQLMLDFAFLQSKHNVDSPRKLPLSDPEVTRAQRRLSELSMQLLKDPLAEQRIERIIGLFTIHVDAGFTAPNLVFSALGSLRKLYEECVSSPDRSDITQMLGRKISELEKLLPQANE